ncbi:MAG: NUDIX hydrolase [Candidatus Woesebacteria bacterium]|nr:NUDIX hydrolase [Candidatus Woesebacteria bacterium]
MSYTISKKAKITSTKTIYKSKWLILRKDSFIKPDGSAASYEIVNRRDIVIVIPQVNKNLIFVEQYRYALDERSLEFPQGFVEENETPKDAAKREFEEEVGFKGSITFLGEACTSSGFLEQKIYIFKGSNLVKGKQKLEPTEKDLNVISLPLKTVKELVKNNKIKNAPTLAALSLFLLNK